MQGNQFEIEVRRLARARWNLPEGDGGAEFINGQEIDAVCRTEDVIHLIMCTVSKKLDKVESDVDKLVQAKHFLEKRGGTVKCWEITFEEPTPDQRKYARQNSVQIESLGVFQSKFIDVNQYFARRKEFRFGSATDPTTETSNISNDEYVPLTIRNPCNGEKQSIASLSKFLEEGKFAVLTADFGSGKSLTLREVFFNLINRYQNSDKKLIPLAINLRDHWGQEDLAEVLRRHAQKIAYSDPNHLVRIWNSGQAIILLDGFDELAVQPILSSIRSRREARKAATRIVREFATAARGRCGFLLCGRLQYFDSIEELQESCGLRTSDLLLELEPFSEEQAKNYLEKKGVNSALPDWLPRTPLLLGYLAARRLIPEVAALGEYDNPTDAWDAFLTLITERDAALSREFGASTIRRLLERLATRTRLSANGHRELDDNDIGIAFKEVTQLAAFDATSLLLQRLPGLTPRTSEVGKRSFVAPHMLEVLRGSDLRGFLLNPFSPFLDGTLQHPLSAFACEVAGRLAARDKINEAQHLVAAREASRRWSDSTLASDCLLAATQRPDCSGVNCQGLILQDGQVDEFDVEESCLSKLTLRTCIINKLRINAVPNDLLFEKCLIGTVEGLVSKDHLPPWLIEPDIINFEAGTTTDSLMELSISLPVRVSLTILRKLFVQSGRGRKEIAFFRGLDSAAQEYVADILQILRSQDVAIRASHGGSVVWHGNPKARARVLQILSAPLSSTDQFVSEVAKLR